MFDLASLLQPQVNPQAQATTADAQPATSKDQWDAYLANPAAKAALLSFGLNALAGGWGSPGQNIAQSIGAGLEAGGQVGANQEAERQRQEALATEERRFQAKMGNEQADRQNRMDIAKLYSSNRLDVAGLKLDAKNNPNAKIQGYQKMALGALTRSDPTFGMKSPEEQAQAVSALAQQLWAQDPEFQNTRGWGDGGGLDGNLGGLPGDGLPGGGILPGTQAPIGSTQTNSPVSSQPTIYRDKAGNRIQWDGKQWVPVR